MFPSSELKWSHLVNKAMLLLNTRDLTKLGTRNELLLLELLASNITS